MKDFPPASNFLISLFVRRKNFALLDFKNIQKEELSIFSNISVHQGMKNFLPQELKLSVLEWVCMQNPLKEFTTERPPLPGQRHPSLRVARVFLNMLIVLAEKKGRDGLLNIPEYFHNGYLYYLKGMLFLNPLYHSYFISIISRAFF